MTILGQETKGHKRVVFAYKCECTDCDEEGRLSVRVDEHGPIACPGGCGAAYLPWRNPLHRNRWELKAVIMPVYDDGPPYVQGDDDEE